MAIDRRELILARISELMAPANIPGIVATFRNEVGIDQKHRPATVLLDGDEQQQLTPSSQQRPGLVPVIMRMKPELYVITKSQLPINAGIGTEVNSWRLKMIHLVANDATLKTLIGTNGRISYQGATTDLKSGSALSGQLRLDFFIDYYFDPTN